IARRLQAEGVGPEVRVALLAGRSPGLLAGMMGILRAGGAFVPLDPSAPPERIAAVLLDSGARVLLAQEELRDRARGFAGAVVPLDGALPHWDAPDMDVPPGALAYVIYTSGSTGAPKGVMVPHRALANLVHAEVELHGFGPWTRHFTTPPASFDASVGDVFPILACGGSLLVHPEPGELTGGEMLRFVREHGADAAGIPVALWSHWLEGLERGWDGEPLPLPETTRVGGESLPIERARAWRRLGGGRSRLFNHYGPTETTVVATVHPADDVEQRETVSGSVPIGRPVPGAEAHVLDRHLRPVPVGVAGELFAGGAQVARGYLGRPDLTAERFVPDPFSAEHGARMYRTGDRVRRLPDGVLEFLGRTDAQLKVRGFRVEPAEVEAALLEHPAVREAAVAVRPGPGGEARLVGWYVASGEGADPAALRRRLRSRLPDYLVPAALLEVDALPLTPNGKLDRAALPEPAAAPSAAYTAPRTPTERALADAWAEALGVERVGVHDDFFDLGGHSLAAARAVARVRERTGRDLPLAELFRGGTVERLARLLDGGEAPVPAAPVLRLRDGAGTPLFCVPAAGGMGAAYLRLARRLDDRPVYALQARGLAPGERPDATVEEMAARHLEAVRAARPRGPYLLAGWSVGGTVAFEMARRLCAAGEEVSLLALIDSWAPLDGNRPPAADDADLLLLLAADLGVRAEPGALAALHRELRALPGDARLTRFEAWARRLDSTLPELDRAGLRRRLAVYRAAADAVAAYRPGLYPGRVTLFRARGGHRPEPDPRLRWRELTDRALDVREVEGSHHSIVVGADVEGLAAALRGVLASAAPA
ncbi:MAG TPA: amino acid adenylation domain-containing protein, partial [Longimicrobiaceae bacterium]|nr:amino acid adenylation domain-containing protein [Longimicrobiaceae bacterium]